MLVALFDCKNFYVSCIRKVVEGLLGVPVIVLGLGDKVIVARSDEAKALGVPMAAPYFQYKDELFRSDVKVYSSDMRYFVEVSNQVMAVIGEMIEHVEYYSIDEAFGWIPFYGEEAEVADIVSYCQKIKEEIYTRTQIPIRVGIGRTKVEAKIAAKIADVRDGVFCVLEEGFNLDEHLESLSVSELWGVGPKTTQKLISHGIETVNALKNARLSRLRGIGGVNLERIGLELRGTPCIQTKDVHGFRKSMRSTGGLRKPTNSKETLKSALAFHARNLFWRMWEQGSATGYIEAFIGTSPFSNNRYFGYGHRQFDDGCFDLLSMTDAVFDIFDEVWKPEIVCSRVGVRVSSFAPRDLVLGATLFGEHQDQNRVKLMQALEHVRNKHASDVLIASELFVSREEWMHEPQWPVFNEGPHWDDIPIVFSERKKKQP